MVRYPFGPFIWVNSCASTHTPASFITQWSGQSPYVGGHCIDAFAFHNKKAIDINATINATNISTNDIFCKFQLIAHLEIDAAADDDDGAEEDPTLPSDEMALEARL